jgi:pimeloyl-ACP methyl ester carboxylesterase
VKLDLPALRSIDLDGPVAYRAWDGPKDTTFVMVHGLGGSHLSWIQVAPGLAGLGQVLALDLPGFGESPRAGRGVTLMAARRTLSRFVSELGSGRVVLCGNSMGGAIAILEAAVEPDAIAGLILTCSVFPWVHGGFPHPAVMGAFGLYRVPVVGERFMVARARAMSPERTVQMGFGYVTANPSAVPQDVRDLHVELLHRRQGDPEAVPTFLEAARSMLRLGRRPDVARRALDNIRAPVLVLHGRRDRLVPAVFAEAELRRHPAWRGRIFPDLGHAPQMEAPGRWLAEVADWYAEEID